MTVLLKIYSTRNLLDLLLRVAIDNIYGGVYRHLVLPHSYISRAFACDVMSPAAGCT